MTVEAALAASTSPGDQRAGEGICRFGRLRADAVWGGFWLGLAAVLFLLSQENFLLFHSLIELFTVAVAITIYHPPRPPPGKVLRSRVKDILKLGTGARTGGFMMSKSVFSTSRVKVAG